jgi:hypothetical protein
MCRAWASGNDVCGIGGRGQGGPEREHATKTNCCLLLRLVS